MKRVKDAVSLVGGVRHWLLPTSDEMEEPAPPAQHAVELGVEGRGVEVGGLGAEREVGRVVDDRGEGVVAESLDQLTGVTCTGGRERAEAKRAWGRG